MGEINRLLGAVFHHNGRNSDVVEITRGTEVVYSLSTTYSLAGVRVVFSESGATTLSPNHNLYYCHILANLVAETGEHTSVTEVELDPYIVSGGTERGYFTTSGKQILANSTRDTELHSTITAEFFGQYYVGGQLLNSSHVNVTLGANTRQITTPAYQVTTRYWITASPPTLQHGGGTATITGHRNYEQHTDVYTYTSGATSGGDVISYSGAVASPTSISCTTATATTLAPVCTVTFPSNTGTAIVTHEIVTTFGELTGTLQYQVMATTSITDIALNWERICQYVDSRFVDERSFGSCTVLNPYEMTEESLYLLVSMRNEGNENFSFDLRNLSLRVSHSGDDDYFSLPHLFDATGTRISSGVVTLHPRDDVYVYLGGFDPSEIYEGTGLFELTMYYNDEDFGETESLYIHTGEDEE